MIIRKLFKFEASHIVRGCFTKRCSQSIHGHSYKVEVFIEADRLDKAEMVIDFGLLKNDIGLFIDSFDHTYVAWSDDKDDLNNAMIKHSDRYIEIPFVPTAEVFALLFVYFLTELLAKKPLLNGESCTISAVRVHETDTGYAEANYADLDMIDVDILRRRTRFSDAITKEWTAHMVNVLAGIGGKS